MKITEGKVIAVVLIVAGILILIASNQLAELCNSVPNLCTW